MKYGTMYDQGSIVLVPFPFTDLSTKKKRPAIIISPNWFNEKQEDIVLLAITSNISSLPDERIDILISKSDISEGEIIKESIIKISKMFTCSKALLLKKVAAIKKEKLEEIFSALHLFLSSG